MDKSIESTFISPDYNIDNRLFWSDMDIELNELIKNNAPVEEVNAYINQHDIGTYGAWYINKMVNRDKAIEEYAQYEDGKITNRKESSAGILKDDVLKTVPSIMVEENIGDLTFNRTGSFGEVSFARGLGEFSAIWKVIYLYLGLDLSYENYYNHFCNFELPNNYIYAIDKCINLSVEIKASYSVSIKDDNLSEYVYTTDIIKYGGRVQKIYYDEDLNKYIVKIRLDSFTFRDRFTNNNTEYHVKIYNIEDDTPLTNQLKYDSNIISTDYEITISNVKIMRQTTKDVPDITYAPTNDTFDNILYNENESLIWIG